MTKAREIKEIHAISLDYDGCYGRKRHTPQGLVKANSQLLKKIFDPSKPNTKIFFVGSNRQDYSANKLNKDVHHNGCCFEAIAVLTKSCQSPNVTLNKLLLADVDGDRPLGYSFDRARENANISHPKHQWDNSKLRILYAQMHHLASENPQAKITFDFYDDRNDLFAGPNSLFELFRTYPHLKPGNVCLNLRYYNSHRNPNATLKVDTCEFSDAPIDYNWQANVKLLAKYRTGNAKSDDYYVDILKVPEFLTARSLPIPNQHPVSSASEQSPHEANSEAQKNKEQHKIALANAAIKIRDYKFALSICETIDPTFFSNNNRKIFYINCAYLYKRCGIKEDKINPYIEGKKLRSARKSFAAGDFVTAYQMYTDINPDRLIAADKNLYYTNYVESLQNQHTFLRDENRISGADFNSILDRYRTTGFWMCFGGLFAGSGAIKELRKLKDKEFVTIKEIREAINKDGNRRLLLFFSANRTLANKTSTDQTLLDLHEACKPKVS